MDVSLVMTVIGPDRPGLVDLLAGLVKRHGGNWLESRMSRLGGQFAGIVRIRIDAEKERDLVEALESVASQGLAVVTHSENEPAAPLQAMSLVHLEVVGHDRPGIVSEISHALALHGVNVEELNTECASAPMSGESLFQAKAKVKVPETCDVRELRSHLEQIAGDLMVHISFEKPLA